MASADQSRGVADGKPADLVNFGRTGHRLPGQGRWRADCDWDADATKRILPGSVVTFCGPCAGNPKNIRAGFNLLCPGIEVITPSPLSLAPAGTQPLRREKTVAGIIKRGSTCQYIANEHVKLRPGRAGSHRCFCPGQRDVLIYENGSHRAPSGRNRCSTSPRRRRSRSKTAGRSGDQHTPWSGDRIQKLPVHRAGAEVMGALVSGRSAVAADLPTCRCRLWTTADLGG